MVARKKVKKKHVVSRGWVEEAVAHDADHVVREKHVPHDPYLSRVVFWSSVFVVIVANILTSVALVPLFAVLTPLFLNVVVAVVALSLGFLYNLLIIDIGHLGRRHHLLAGVIVPLIAVANVVVMAGVGNQIIDALAIQNVKQSPLISAVVYGVAFIVPFLVDRLLVRMKKKPLLKSF